MITKLCPICNEQYQTTNQNQKYCSRKCQHRSMSKKVEITCNNCGKLIVTNKGRKFCSLECSYAFTKAYHASINNRICPVCNNSFRANYKGNIFCSRECANKGRRRPHYTVSDEEKQKRSERLKAQWQDESYRESVVSRMKENNPVHMPGVIEKANASRAKNGLMKNNFKYGNGKISPYEQLVKEKIEKLGFHYNYAIKTGDIRKDYPEARYPNNYKPDFVNLETRLCIEIDGHGHSSAKEVELDRKKEHCLSLLGYTTLRFTHAEIDEGVFDEWLNSYRKNI